MNRPLAYLLSTLILCGAVAPIAHAETAYFVVAQPAFYDLYLVGIYLGDAYVLPLHEPSDIELARDLVAGGGGNLIVSAWVTKGADGLNRNWIGEGSPLWSWHVTEFMGFSDTTIEVCDGNPTFTEAESLNWAEGEGTQICYWAYRVVAEVTSVPTRSSSWSRIKALY